MRIFLITLSILIGFLGNAHAQDLNFCEALSKDGIYKENSSYKKLVEGKDGWIFRTKTDFTDNFKMNSALKERFTRLQKALKNQNIELVIALLPTRGMIHRKMVDYPRYDADVAIKSHDELLEGVKEVGIPIAAVEDFETPQDFYYKRDHHWNASGAKLMAEKVAVEVKKLSVYADIPKIPYKTESADTLVHKGTFTSFVNKTCSLSIKDETVPAYKTFEVGKSEVEDLFTDKKKADIVLVGTSNSTQVASHANFDGFLKEYIGADVENLSVSGGGVDTAMLRWFNSEKYKEHKPKIVIWEVPVYQNFKGSPFYRQAIPAVYGDCVGKEVLNEEVLIEKGRFNILESILKKEITAKNHYLKLKFTDFEGRKFRLTTNYQDGKKDPFGFRRSKFFEPDGVFFLEFDQGNESSVSSIEGVMPKGTKGKVRISVCRFPETEVIQKK